MDRHWQTLAVITMALMVTGCATNTTRVTIPPLPAGVAIQRSAGNVSTVGYLYRPDGTGARPAVILLHGCAGLEEATSRLLSDSAHWYVQRGYVAMIVDSYGPRGHANLCGRSDTVVPYPTRAWDAAAAADFLVRAGHADKDKIVVQGLSAGGASALHAVGPVGPPAGTFAAAIAWYPVCEPWAIHTIKAPVLVLAGGADKWTPASRCTSIGDTLKGKAGPEFTLRIFEGATHSYDFPFPARTYLGQFMQFDPSATRESWKEIEAFLAKYVR